MIGFMCLLPVLHVFALSFSSKLEVTSGHVSLIPRAFTTINYRIVMKDAQFFRSYGVTFLRAILGWMISIILIVLSAYPLSQRESIFPARSKLVTYYMIVMIFSGGMIPTYLVVNELGLIDTIWALVLPGAISIYYVVLMMNFMKALPESLQESAFIDGANHFTVLFRIILPLCLPSLATISLFIIMNHWNAWFDGALYIRKSELKPLQTYLRSFIISETLDSAGVEDEEDLISTDAVNGAKIFLAMLPILCVYPFLQKYFAKGLVRGSVKE